MSKVYLEDSNLTNIANAIRSKNGETTTYKPSEMATAIENIPSSGEEYIYDYLYFTYPFSSKISTNKIDLSKAFTNGSYTFAQDASLKVLKSNSNYNVSSGICYCYIKIDCTNTKAKINIKSYVSSESSWDYGLIYYTKTIPTSYPSTSTVKNWTIGSSNSHGILLGKNSGDNARIDIETNFENGIYYLIYGYVKDTSGNFNLDRYFIEKINIEVGNPKICLDFRDKKYSINSSNMNTIRSYKEQNEGVLLDLTSTFSSTLSSSNIETLRTNKDLFKNIHSYRYFLGSSGPSSSAVLPDDFSTFFTIDENTEDLYAMFINFSCATNLDIINARSENVKTIANMFANCSKLTSLNVSGLNTKNVTDMSGMFQGCSSLKSIDISNFDTRNCTNVNNMFYNCTNLTELKLGKNFSPKVSTISMFSSVFNNINIDFDGNTNFSSYNGSSTLNLAQFWKGSDSAYKILFEKFANSLGTKNSSYTRTIKIYTDLYNSLSSTQKALITNKGYSLSYGTS